MKTETPKPRRPDPSISISVSLKSLDHFWRDGDEQYNKRIIVGILKNRYAAHYGFLPENVKVIGE